MRSMKEVSGSGEKGKGDFGGVGETMYNKVYIEITNICNMSCSFCHGHKRAPRRMNREEFDRYVRDLAEFATNAANQGTIVVFRLWNKGHDDDKNERAFRMLKDIISGEWVENTRGIRIWDKMHIEWGERFEWPDSDAKVKGDKFFCYGLKDQFGILADGTVVPCCLDSDGVICLGNLFEEDLDVILNSKRAMDMVEGFQCGVASEELCKRCGYARRFV